MDFGAIDDPRALEGIDFRLPEDDPRSLPSLNRKPGASIHLGLPIWAERSWVGRLYPPGTTPGEHLNAYSAQFSAIELNSTHYATPSLETLRKWRESVPESFRFCPKILQDISHRMGSADTPRLLESFFVAASELGATLGPCFLQLPPQFGPDRLPMLKRLLTLTPPTVKLAVEFRHPAWFEGGTLVAPAFDTLAKFKAGTVICDVPGRRDVSHSTLTAPWVLVRFLGKHGHPSTEDRLSSWATRLDRWFEHGLENLYFFVHELQNTNAPEIASSFIREVNARDFAPKLSDWKRWDVPDQLSLL